MAPTFMQVEKSQDLQPASWGPTRAYGVSPSPSLSLKAEADQCPSSEIVRRESKFSLSLLFYSNLSGLDEAHHYGEGNLLY